ncbi:MAG: response regulator transcription factor [Dehalococcoidia bacterium]
MEEASNNTDMEVLLVEDDRSLRRVLRLTLECAGFQIAEASNGGEALQSLEERSIEAVVLNLGLPDGQGPAVLDRLRHLSQRTVHPVWVITSALDQEEATQRYGSLSGVFLAKPFDPWALVRTLEGLLSARSKE